MNAIEMISKERREQIEKHGRTLDYDMKYNNKEQLLEAAVSLITDEAGFLVKKNFTKPEGWDEDIWEHMISKTKVEKLIRAGAFIAAQIDVELYKTKL